LGLGRLCETSGVLRCPRGRPVAAVAAPHAWGYGGGPQQGGCPEKPESPMHCCGARACVEADRPNSGNNEHTKIQQKTKGYLPPIHRKVPDRRPLPSGVRSPAGGNQSSCRGFGLGGWASRESHDQWSWRRGPWSRGF
jgi:hypothetical protein